MKLLCLLTTVVIVAINGSLNFGSIEAQQVCTGGDADLVFLVDRSGSVRAENFEKVQKFLRDVVTKSNVQASKVHVSMIGFASSSDVIFKNLANKQDVLSKISAMRFTRGGTSTDLALKQAAGVIGSNLRKTTEKIVVLITDGYSRSAKWTIAAATTLKAISNVKIIVIGVGSNLNQNELNKVSSSGTFIKSSDFDHLKDQVEKISKVTCKDVIHEVSDWSTQSNRFIYGVGAAKFKWFKNNEKACQSYCLATKSCVSYNFRVSDGRCDLRKIRSPISARTNWKAVVLKKKRAQCSKGVADLIFLVDRSGSVGNKNFKQVRKFLTTIVQQSEISKAGIRVSLVSFSTSSKLVTQNNWNQRDVLRKIRRLSNPSGTTATGAALNAAKNMIDKTLRKSSKKVVVMITDGQSTYPARTKDAAAKLKALSNVVVIVLGVGSRLDEAELKYISSTNRYIHPNNFDELNDQVGEITKHSCK